MNRDVTYAIPTTVIDREVIHAIPTAERVSGRLLESAMDREVKHAITTTVAIMIRGQVVRPLIVTMGEQSDDLRGCLVVGQRFQDRRRTTTSDYAMKMEERLMEQRSLAIPMSSTRLRDRPRRTTRLPVRFKDFQLKK